MAIRPINVLSLCSGVGGIELGLKLAEPRARTVCYVEWEAYAAATLVARMADKALDSAPVWDNVKTFDGHPWRGVVDCVVGGYPCQPFSVAGKRRGTNDPRHLWPHIARIVREVSPTICFFENVPNHLNLGFQSVCEDLWDMGYRVEAGIFSAAEVGAPHLRKRLFIMAHRDGAGLKIERGGGVPNGDTARRDDADGCCRAAMADSEGNGWDKGGTESARLEGRLDTPIGCGSMADSGQSGPQGWSGLEQTNTERKAKIGLGEDAAGCSGVLADTGSQHIRLEPGRFRGKSWPDSPFPPEPGDAKKWAGMPNDAQPAVRRDADGSAPTLDMRLSAFKNWKCINNSEKTSEIDKQNLVPKCPHVCSRVDRLRCLGNAVVPQVAALAWRTLMMRLGG